MPRQSFKLEAEVPAELIQNIFKFSDLPSLVNLMTTSKWISDIARTTLYQSIDLDLDRARLASCMKALLNSDVSELVHRLRVDFDRRDPGGPHPILFSDKEGVELIRCLKRLPNLQRLTLNMTLFDTAKPLNDVFPFKLIEFSTTLACGGDLLSFVERQSTLQELGIDSVIEDPGLLDGVRLPEIRVLRWGHEPDPKPAAFELIKRIPTVQDIHVIFSEPGIMEATMDTLKLWKTRAKPTRAFVTILFNSCAMSLVSAGIEGLNHISLIESVDDLGCFNNVRELQLNNYCALNTLNFLWTEATWRNFELGGGLDEAIRSWFIECPSLRNITFDTMGTHGVRREETRSRKFETGR